MRSSPFRRSPADRRRGRLVLLIAILCLLSPATRGAGIADAWQGTYWGEPSRALVAHFGARATALARPLDFGDSYADVVLRNVPVGGFALIAYFQMDKTTGGLKRIQLERPRHGVTPPAFRAVLAALETALGTPDAMCGVPPVPASGYQAAAERVWSRNGVVIRAIFRDTTLEAFEGCLLTGSCGLTAQLLVRISPPGGDPGRCPTPPLP